jgi:hypothetical protein
MQEMIDVEGISSQIATSLPLAGIQNRLPHVFTSTGERPRIGERAARIEAGFDETPLELARGQN